MTKAMQPIPPGFHALTPHLVIADAAKAIDFYKKAFGAEEMGRMPGPDGRIMHAQITIGGSPLMLNDEIPEMGARGPKSLGGTPVTIHLYVTDADKVYNQAVAAGAKPIMPLADQFWGDRYGIVEDPFGHRWSIATHVEDLTHDEIARRGQEMMSKM